MRFNMSLSCLVSAAMTTMSGRVSHLSATRPPEVEENSFELSESAVNGPTVNGNVLFSFRMQLFDLQGDGLTAQQFPLTIDLSDFQQAGDTHRVSLLWEDRNLGTSSSSSGIITSLSIISAVPEPTAALIPGSLCFLSMYRRRRRDRRQPLDVCYFLNGTPQILHRQIP